MEEEDNRMAFIWATDQGVRKVKLELLCDPWFLRVCPNSLHNKCHGLLLSMTFSSGPPGSAPDLLRRWEKGQEADSLTHL